MLRALSCVRAACMVRIAEIFNLIRRQKNKSTDLMNIPRFIYKILAHIISSTIATLFNNSFSEGIFPECFKTAKIIPILKYGDSNSTVNYRPISMLPFLTKMFEKLKRYTGLLPKINYIGCNY